MDIWVPYTDLADETGAFALRGGAHLWRLDDPVEGYGRFMADRWDEGESFIVIEHDVVPTRNAIDSLQVCPRPLCFFGYEGEDRLSLMFGCVRFSADFIAAHPDLWTRFLAARDVAEGHPDYDFSASRCRRWMMLPEWVDHATGAPAHFHGRVRHLARMAGRR
jgi:hypothetical protein